MASYSPRIARQIALVHHLLDALEAAEDAFDRGTALERERALDAAIRVISEIYGSLDTDASPEASAHLEAACDACLEALGEAYTGSSAALSRAASFFRALRGALSPRAARHRAAA